MNRQSAADNMITTPAEILYILFYCIILSGKAFGLAEDSILYRILLFAGLLFLFIKTLLTEYTKSSLLLTITVYCIAIFSYVRSKDLGFLLCCAVLIGIYKCQLKHVLVPVVCLWSGAFVFMTIATQAGLLQDHYYVHDKTGLGYIVRNSFGYPHPNVLHISFLMITCLVMYLWGRGKKNSLRLTFLLALANIYVFIYSVSFTGLLISIIYLLLNYIVEVCIANSRAEGHLGHVIDLLMILVFPICVLFSVAGPVTFHGALYDLSDKIVHHRFVLSNFYLTQEKLTLFGHVLSHTPDANRSIDCSYVYLLVHNGLVPFILFCIFYMAAIWSCIRKHEYQRVCVILACAIAGITEPFLFNTSFKNTSLIFAGDCLFNMLPLQAKDRKSICLIPFMNRSITLRRVRTLHYNIGQLSQKSGAAFRKHRTAIFLLCTGSFLCTLLIAPRFMLQHTGVLIPTEYCSDGYPDPPHTYTAAELKMFQEEGIRLLSCEPGKELALFQGKTIVYENVRTVNNLAVCVTLLTLIIILLVACMHDLKPESHAVCSEDAADTDHPLH